MTKKDGRSLFRNRDGDEGEKVTNIELFYDLVFVFAITQLSHRFMSYLTTRGVIETLILFLAVWWLWIFTSWATNWLDPERGPVRAMLLIMMVGGLVMSTALPNAFGAMGMTFAVAYVTMQVFRSLAIVVASRRHDRARAQNFLRITFYFLLSAPLWIAGALAPHDSRLWWWAGALGIEYAGPALLFQTPFLGRSSAGDWDISGAHMAERCSLFVIIALGEALLVSGSAFGAAPHDTPTIAAFLVVIAGSAAMWWVYFDLGAKRGTDHIEKSSNPGRIARSAYTYFHMPIIAGIVVGAVADQQLLAQPLAASGLMRAAVAIGGPAIFLLGTMVFKRISAASDRLPLSHLVGLGLLVLMAPVAPFVPLIATGTAATIALIVVAVWEAVSVMRNPELAEAEPKPAR